MTAAPKRVTIATMLTAPRNKLFLSDSRADSAWRAALDRALAALSAQLPHAG